MPSSEPNHKMDDLLRTYAKKRQEKVQRPFALTESSRRQLHQEVAHVVRRRPRKSKAKGTSWWASLGGFWPQVGFCAAVGFALFIIVMFLVPDDKNNTRNLPVAAIAPVPEETTNAVVASTVAAPEPTPVIVAAAKPAPVEVDKVQPPVAPPAAPPALVVNEKPKPAIVTNTAPVFAANDVPRKKDVKSEAADEFRTRGFGNAANPPPAASAVVSTPPPPKPAVVAQLDKDKEAAAKDAAKAAFARREFAQNNAVSQAAPDRSQNAASGNRDAVEHYSSAPKPMPAPSAPVVTTTPPSVSKPEKPVEIAKAKQTPAPDLAVVAKKSKPATKPAQPKPAVALTTNVTPVASQPVVTRPVAVEAKPVAVTPLAKVENKPKAVVAVTPPGTATGTVAPASTLTGTVFARTDASSQSKVLSAFNVERDGDTVRVKDIDGTKYQGEIIIAPSSPSQKKSRSKKTTTTDASAPDLQTNYSFQVTGYNWNLRQNVVFTGNVLTDGNSVAQKVTGRIEVGTANGFPIEAALKR